MRYIAALIVAGLLAGIPACSPGSAGDHLYWYLLVDVVGPEEWAAEHTFSVRWDGKDVPLPVVFRVPVAGGSFEMGAADEASGRLEIGGVRVPVAATPATAFRVRNTGVVGAVAEVGLRKGASGSAIVTSVTVSPPDQPGELSPVAEDGERRAAREMLEKRLREVVAGGGVIDVVPGK